MRRRIATTYSDYQSLSRSFEIGDRVYPFFEGSSDQSGVVLAVFPAIGMVDVQFPHGSTRMPVEDLQIDESAESADMSMIEDSVPGGLGVVPVSTGASRVASKYVGSKTALYWGAKDRKYRLRKDEHDPTCPKCAVALKNTCYKRRDGVSERLLGCPSCLFLIKQEDIIGGF